MYKIAIIVGTRPEAIKLMPVFLAFQNVKDFQVDLISTGQHKEMLDQVFDIFKVDPDVSLNLMTSNQTLNGLASKLTSNIDSILLQNNYNGVIVQGDTLTAMISAMVAFNNKISVFHVEAGLRSYDLGHPFPEEANRKVIGVYASMNFTPTEKASRALLKEGYSLDIVVNVGNTVIGALNKVVGFINENPVKYENEFSKIISNKRKYILITAHRRENFGNGFSNICEAILELANKHKDVDFVYPVHLNPNVQNIVKSTLKNISNIKLISPITYDNMVYLMSKSYLILSDSGGIQEEAPSLNKPVVVMREKTERMEGVEKGCSVLVGTSKERIVNTVNELLINTNLYSEMSNVSNPYGDGESSNRIVKHITKFYKSNQY
jgi:UDP-N-acetylglucosamine 2-epimerase (non-hydrolysing)